MCNLGLVAKNRGTELHRKDAWPVGVVVAHGGGNLEMEDLYIAPCQFQTFGEPTEQVGESNPGLRLGLSL